MNAMRLLPLGAILGAALAVASPVQADTKGYAVTITNLTRDQNFTPIMVASHRDEIGLFELGDPASAALAALAEAGDFSALASGLEADPSVVDVANSGGLLEPGQSVTVHVGADRGARRISLAAMLIPTNDGFLALQSVAAPRGQDSQVYYSPAYDAGSEPNDELCISIPGPDCGGTGLSPGIDGEGYVHVHGGIHGIGDLLPSAYDWRNPVARIEIRRQR